MQYARTRRAVSLGSLTLVSSTVPPYQYALFSLYKMTEKKMEDNIGKRLKSTHNTPFLKGLMEPHSGNRPQKYQDIDGA